MLQRSRILAWIPHSYCPPDGDTQGLTPLVMSGASSPCPPVSDPVCGLDGMSTGCEELIAWRDGMGWDGMGLRGDGVGMRECASAGYLLLALKLALLYSDARPDSDGECSIGTRDVRPHKHRFGGTGER
jgi:hypothetical protein